jgi:polysaccharide biosynthesis/export protein
MKRRLFIIVEMLLVIICCSCVSKKEMVYLQGSEKLSLNSDTISQNYEIKIQDDDLLSIAVSSKDKELLEPFGNNFLFGTSGAQGSSQASSQSDVTYFRVDQEGDIILPILGQIHAAGLTRSQFAEKVKNKIIDLKYLKDPIVSVRLKNFKFSVMGAVTVPGQYTVDGERVTVLEALAKAGDLSAGGLRTNVLLLRENNGKRTTHKLDLTNINLVESPYYYLQQNDILYVEPNSSIIVQGSPAYTYVSVGGTVVSLFVSLVSLIVTLSR